MTTRFFALAFVYVIATSAPAVAQGRLTGNVWVSLGTGNSAGLVKDTYAAALIDGALNLGSNLMTAAVALDDRMTASQAQAYRQAVTKYLVGMNAKQLRDGLDSFFADFRNRRIAVVDAALVVVLQVSGLATDDVDAMVDKLRAEAPQ